MIFTLRLPAASGHPVHVMLITLQVYTIDDIGLCRLLKQHNLSGHQAASLSSRLRG